MSTPQTNIQDPIADAPGQPTSPAEKKHEKDGRSESLVAEAKRDTGLDEETPEEGEDEDEETCGFCKYMKGGGCKTAFVSWMNCVEDEKEKNGDYVEQCIPHMTALRDCMLKNPDYYGPVLDEEAHMIDNEDESKDVKDGAQEAHDSGPVVSETDLEGQAAPTDLLVQSNGEHEAQSTWLQEQPVSDEASGSQSIQLEDTSNTVETAGIPSNKQH